MTSTPPVPPGNTSPYPIQEPPHPPAPPSSSKAADEWAEPAQKRGWSLGKIVGAAAGVGAIAIGVAAVLFPRDSEPATKKKKSRKR